MLVSQLKYMLDFQPGLQEGEASVR